MRNVNAQIISAYQSRQFFEYYLLDLALDPNIYYTDFDHPIVYDGNRYLPHDFTVEKVDVAAMMSIDSVGVRFGDADRQLTAVLIAGDHRFALCRIYIGVMLDFVPYVCEVFRGYLGEWTIDEYEVEVEIVNEFFMWRKRALRRCGVSCAWTFRDASTCRHSGEGSWCDQSFARCRALGNTNNFGGDRYAASTAEKQLWWGRVPK